MLLSKADLMKKVKELLMEATGHIKANKLAARCRTYEARIYGIIRALKEGTKTTLPLGIHSGKKGYILSEFASKQDDVEYLRRLNGAQTSVFISANAAAPHVRKRWNTLDDKRAYELIFRPFLLGNDLKKGAKILEEKSN